jgi:hypothetical protein
MTSTQAYHSKLESTSEMNPAVGQLSAAGLSVTQKWFDNYV